MPQIDFKQKLSFQRPFSQHIEAQEEYEIVRQFESDRGRIINCAAIRRLQQKTQVFPLERNAAVRSRLTHSLEVQQVGRHIAKEIINHLKRKESIALFGLTHLLDPFESIVEMACLMHDIGNPPFGHFGESAINNWFRQHLDLAGINRGLSALDGCQAAPLCLQEGEEELNNVRKRVRHDLCHFDGNAQAIRLVHSLLKLNLTYAQVACILKYTRPAYWATGLPASHSYLFKKPGYYLAEEEFIAALRAELAMGEFDRFPLTYIMEAADDISYCIADLEDAVEKGIFTVEQLYSYLAKEWGEIAPDSLFDNTVGCALRKITNSCARRNSKDEFFMYLRVFTVANLVPYVAQRFIDNLPAVFAGNFNQALLGEEGPEHRLLTVFKNVALKYVFNHAEVEQLELQGYRVISGLLDIYQPLLAMPMPAFIQLMYEGYHLGYPIETRLYHKLSPKHRLAYGEALEKVAHYPEQEKGLWEYYFRARLVQDYISGMTDLYAYDEYRKLMAAE